MTTEVKTTDQATPEMERNHEMQRKVFIPAVDILEKNDTYVVMADMPGVSEDAIDITLEKNVLTIHGTVKPVAHEGYELAYAEYEIGDYERSFTLTDDVDREKIEATLKNGVLHLTMPKAAPAIAKKISVKVA
ncbi:MAG: Hsp20/alpha crystallin family protein [Gemmatimonadetes bacterium]|nr:MAG: Hsp20/alpha crystallin family protein [Gemmatimonadota bacterium]